MVKLKTFHLLQHHNWNTHPGYYMKSISEMEGVQQKPLKYSIHACSSHSGASRPAHGSLYLFCSSFIHSGKYHGGPAIWSDVKVLSKSIAHKPWLAVSRWSSDTNSPPQYLVLRWLTWKSNQIKENLKTLFRLEWPAIVTNLDILMEFIWKT